MNTRERCRAAMIEFLNDQLGEKPYCDITIERILTWTVCYAGFSLKTARETLLALVSQYRRDIARHATSSGIIEATNKCGTVGMERIRAWRTIDDGRSRNVTHIVYTGRFS